MQCIWYILEPINFNICKYHLKYSASTGSGSATLLRTQCTYMHHFKSLALIDSLQYIIHYLKCTPRHFSFRTQITAVQVHFKTQCVHSLHISKAALLKVFISWTSKCELFSVKGIFTISSTKKTIILYFALSVSTGKIVSSVQKVIISSGSKYCMYRI